VKRFSAIRRCLACLALAPTLAWGFGPDICWLTSGELSNCTPLPADCAPGDDSETCLSEEGSMSSSISDLTQSQTGKHSMVHMDFTYFTAQFLGFTPDEAFYIAAYDDGTDLGRYTQRNINGQLIADPDACDAGADDPNCRYTTKKIVGVSKVNVLTGGLFFHFHAPYNERRASPIPGIDGLHPVVESPSAEVFLHQLRNWADPTSGVDMLCVMGITTNDTGNPLNFYDGSQCFSADTNKIDRVSGTLNYREELAAKPIVIPFSPRLGLLVIQKDTDGTTITSENFDSYIGPYARMARIGLYIHAYQDRVSHHVCGDNSFLYGPHPKLGATFKENMGNPDCDQRLHVLRHAWETGTSQSSLASTNQTLFAGLSGTFDELTHFALSLHPVSKQALAPMYRQLFLSDMFTALQVADPKERLTAVSAVGAQYGLAPLPGY